MAEQTDMHKVKLIVVVTVSAAALVALALLLLFIMGSDVSAVSDASSGTVMQAVNPTDGSDSGANSDELPTGIEGEHKVEPGSGALPALDWEGVISASGEFDLNSVPDKVEVPLASSDEYSVILDLLKSVDSEFSPEGYLVQAHNGIDKSFTGGSGNVWATLYVGEVETSSCYIIAVSDGSIKHVSVKSVFHPAPDKLNQIAQMKSAFEASTAGQREIERVKASLWPDASGTEPYAYSEDYYFDFASDRLWLYVNDKRWVGEYELRRIEPRYGSIDCLEVLANG